MVITNGIRSNITPVYNCILDGFGLGKRKSADAIHQAVKTGRAPFLANLFRNYPYERLSASGRAVGLPPGTMGNSEVNHLNMGAGSRVYQSIERIDVAIRDGSFFGNEALLEAVANVKKNESTLHIMGIIQGHGGTVHGSIKHLFALLELVKKEELKNVVIHLFTDGRDTNPNAAGEIYLKMLEEKIAELKLHEIVKIKTVMGREIAMDRDTAWDKTLTALKALVSGESEFRANSAQEAIEQSYRRNQTDEFIRPTIIGEYQGIQPLDSVIFFNFRQDRGIQLTTAFRESDLKFFNYKKKGDLQLITISSFGSAYYQGQLTEAFSIQDTAGCINEETFSEIQRIRERIKNIVFVAMTEYYPGLNALSAFPEKEIPETVGEIVANANLRQLRLAGPEKFAHVTGWYSGRRLKPFSGENRYMASDPTLKGRTENGKRYDLAPEMTAYIETDYALRAIEQNIYSLIVHNFQNGDMIGHTGNFDAAVAAISCISYCLSRIVPSFIKRGGIFVLTADHGNADEMLIKKGGGFVPSTQHSMNLVPFWVLGKEVKLRNRGTVPDIGVSVLDLIGLPRSSKMTAESLIH
jgi:2,3-bisphosphoglycerate-independent phosphoglycerate mutase